MFYNDVVTVGQGGIYRDLVGGGGGGGRCSGVVLCQSCSPPIPHGGWSHSSPHIR